MPVSPHGKRVALVQSNYIPWKGYFDMVAGVDEFIFYDDRQYTHEDWRNRNRIKTARGPQWLTIPVERRLGQRIDEARISDPRWAVRHWKTLSQTYARAPHFDELRDSFAAAYSECGDEPMLASVNRRLIAEVCASLRIETRLVDVAAYQVEGDRTERIVSICLAAGAAVYLSGPRARSYLEPSLFADAGIELEWMDYDGYPEYHQLHPPFVHEVTILDLLFNTGARAAGYMKLVGPASAGRPDAQAGSSPRAARGS